MSDSSRERYFDNAATTPIDPRVLAEMLPYLESDFGNANSIHSLGRKARGAVEQARARLASLLGCSPDEVTFTSGATEANNWVIQSFQSGAVGPIEHSSIYGPAMALGFSFLSNFGYEIEPPIEDVELVSLMQVNNETGAVLTMPELSKTNPPRVHRDVTQALGKVAFDLEGINYASMSSHKLYGPKGVGALYIKNAEQLEPLIYGGEQEHGLRSGTLNVPGIVGFGAACEIARDQFEADREHASSLRNIVLESLSKVPDWRENCYETNSPFVLSVSFFGIEGESLVVQSDLKGYAISSGPACSSGSNEPSRILTALGLEPEWVRGTVRLSFSRWNTADSARALGLVLSESVTKLRALGN